MREGCSAGQAGALGLPPRETTRGLVSGSCSLSPHTPHASARGPQVRSWGKRHTRHVRVISTQHSAAAWRFGLRCACAASVGWRESVSARVPTPMPTAPANPPAPLPTEIASTHRHRHAGDRQTHYQDKATIAIESKQRHAGV